MENLKIQNIFKVQKHSYNSIILLGIASLFILSFINSCAIRHSKPKELNCIVPQQNCEQMPYDGAKLDTSYSSALTNGYYYQIKTVMGLNTKENEYALTGFADAIISSSNPTNKNSKYSKYALLTYEEPSTNEIRKYNNLKTPYIQNLRKVRFASPANAAFEGEALTNENNNTHIGLLNIGNNSSFVAVSSFPNEKGKLIDQEQIIGLSKIIEVPHNSINSQGGIDIYNYIFESIKEHFNSSNNGNKDLYKGIANFYPNLYQKNDTTDISLFISHPALHPNGRVLFFVSNYYNYQKKIVNKSDVYRGNEIYMIIKKRDNNWTFPINCGNIINTDCDEISPFVTNDGSQLLFSSSGHNNIGGYDIFSSKIDNGVLKNIISQLDKNGKIDEQYTNDLFGKPTNIGSPINTTADELFANCPGDCDSVMYYSSDQNKENGFDIYVKYKTFVNKQIADKSKPMIDDFTIKSENFPNEVPALPTLDIIKEEKITLEGVIKNEKTSEPIEGANIVSKYTKTGEKISETVSNEKGEYSLEIPKGKDVEVVAQSADLFYDKFNVRIDTGGTTKIIRMDFKLPEMLTLRVNFPYDEYKEPYKFTLDSNGIETDETWQKAIDLVATNILESIDKMKKVIIIGHTDDIASVDYNNKLGKNRAEFISQELQNRGVPKSKIEVRTAGKSKLLIKRPNEDIDTYRKRLRRVTFEKIF